MEETIFILLLLTTIGTAANLFLYCKYGNKRVNSVTTCLNNLRKVIENTNSIVSGNEKQAVVRDNSLRTLISKNYQKHETELNRLVKDSDNRIVCLESKISDEIQASLMTIQNDMQHSYNSLSKGFKSKLNEITTELNDINQNLREVKDSILKTQAQSFISIEKK